MKRVKKISLNGTWKVINNEKKIETAIDIPGTVYEALINNKIIPDPFYGNNEHDVNWVYESDWIFEKSFEIKEEILSYSNILLRFYGIDLIAKIFLNDTFIGKTSNMFKTHEFDIHNILRKGINTIRLFFKSPLKHAEEMIKKHGTNLKTNDSLPGIPYLRKAQYSFGWDWGPKLPDIGIWKNVEIICHDGLLINSLKIDQELTYNKNPNEILGSNELAKLKIVQAKIIISLELIISPKKLKEGNYQLLFNIITPDGEILEKKTSLKEINQHVEFIINNPLLWWTHDLGKPNLHELKVEIIKDGIIDALETKFGIRDLKLIRKKDKWGETFYFRLNGVPIFAKGANWVPIDSFIPRGKKLGLYENLLRDVKIANMNFLRVWGGGIYEDDLFYEMCDEFGILVWQDFPFACAIYPYNEEFVNNIELEFIQNVIRLRNHPSLALWCGNNEIEWLWKLELIISEITDEKLIKNHEKAYLKIFEELLPNLIEKFDGTHPYWPSSPSNGFIGNDLGRVNSNSPDRGDSHFWEVWHQNKPFKAYRTFYSRFMSEFGFESFPSIKTIMEFCPQEQFNMFSPIMENHQKNSAGNKKILRYMKKRFLIPENFEDQIVLSQITQAEAIEYGVEHWRRNRNDFRCMGSLYWQLNDCWPVASWSSIDYFGRWKALHYFAKRFYSPLFPNILETKDFIEFWITNDHVELKECSLEWKIYNSENNLIAHKNHDIKVNPCSSQLIEKVELNNVNINRSNAHDHVIFYKLSENGEIKRGFRFLDDPKKFNLKDPEINWELEKYLNFKNNKNKLSIFISTKNIAIYVHIDSKKYDFLADDNFFSMEPGESRKIVLSNIKPLNSAHDSKLDIKKEDFLVRSLFDLIN